MSAKIISHGGYVAGWLDTNIHDFLVVLPRGTARAKYALITCLDSNTNLAEVRDKSPELSALKKKLQIVGNGLLLPTELLLESDAQNQIFFGFDELWFFPSRSIRPKPPSAVCLNWRDGA